MTKWRHVKTPRFSQAFSKQYLEGVENKEKSAKGLQNDAPKKKSHEMSPKLQWFRILVRRHDTETISNTFRAQEEVGPNAQAANQGKLARCHRHPVRNGPHCLCQISHSRTISTVQTSMNCLAAVSAPCCYGCGRNGSIEQHGRHGFTRRVLLVENVQHGLSTNSPAVTSSSCSSTMQNIAKTQDTTVPS